jgi:hypothetical protein
MAATAITHKAITALKNKMAARSGGHFQIQT